VIPDVPEAETLRKDQGQRMCRGKKTKTLQDKGRDPVTYHGYRVIIHHQRDRCQGRTDHRNGGPPDMVPLLVKIRPEFADKVVYEYGKPVIYCKLLKALYGTLQAALLFWKELSLHLRQQGFEANPYDWCVMNKMVNGKQITVGWQVDDLKISCVDQQPIEDLLSSLQDRFGNEAPLTVNRGKVHEYLGMTIDYSTPGKVRYIMKVLDDLPSNLKLREAVTLAAEHLMNLNDSCRKLCEEDKEAFHHLVAKLLYLSKRARPDIQTAVAFLCTRVKSPDEDDYKKLARCISYL